MAPNHIKGTLIINRIPGSPQNFPLSSQLCCRIAQHHKRKRN